MKILFASLVLLAACARTSATVGPFANGLVRPGLDVFLADVSTALRGKRIGLNANHSAIDRAGRPAIDRIAQHEDLELVALFAPEHGIRGTAAAGEKVEDARDSKTGLPIYSLYKTEDRGPADSMLTNVDALDEIRRQHTADFRWTASIDRLAGTDRVRLAIEGGMLPALLDEWDRAAAAFQRETLAIHLYQ